VPSAPILIVDDDPTILQLLSETLQLEGYRVATAANGAEALAQVERARPSLVLLDMRMPVLDGWDFASQLRQRGIELPIVVMTAAANASQWAAEIKASAYLAKPFDIGELLQAVEAQRSDS
jgi:two-component system chemotaxis response regulator CheY